ncbi:MAG: 16S rRNA (uracil(1498)-N(3))-methyltransferase [Deltaproteobacteria bacterium]|nr:16S rRNA (uracil(1498)-N(3))-methyltransferase [Deltaproteobacteria bacterium]
MTVPKIHLPRILEKGRQYDLEKEHLRYLKSVLRLKRDSGLILFDKTGAACDAVIRKLDSEGIRVEITGRRHVPADVIDITLCQSLPKSNKMDEIVQKTTELGVRRIVPFQSFRSVPRFDTKGGQAKVARWRKIAQEASRQSGRPDIPEVLDILTLEDALGTSKEEDFRMIFWEEETKRVIRHVLRDLCVPQTTGFSIVVGPEGGFTDDEVESAVAAGYVSTTLGERILKVETASVVILAVLQYEWGIFSRNPAQDENHAR